jgi:hypothetical protein
VVSLGGGVLSDTVDCAGTVAAPRQRLAFDLDPCGALLKFRTEKRPGGNMGAGIIQGFIGLAIVFWLAMAIPTSLIANQVGHPKWISYAVWCPFTVGWIVVGLVLVFPKTANNEILGAANFLFWVPASVYLSVLALKFRNHQARKAQISN